MTNIKKSRVEIINNTTYLEFTPECMKFPTRLPVIRSGSRDEQNAWTWDGDLENPTLRPSIKTTYTNNKGESVVIHYWLNDGVCKCLSDCTDGNANKLIKLKHI